MGQNKAIDKNDLPAYLPKDVLGWTTAGEDQWFDPQTIFDYIDGGGEIYRAYNFQRLFVRRLKKAGQPDIIVDFFDMGSAKDAFGVFTHDLEGDDWGIGQGSTYKSGLLSFWRDRYFISLTAEAETPETKAALMALGKHIAAATGKDGAKPALLNFLPTRMASEKNVHYFHNHIILNYHFFVSDGNILKLDQTTEADPGQNRRKRRTGAICCSSDMRIRRRPLKPMPASRRSTCPTRSSPALSRPRTRSGRRPVPRADS